MSHERVVCLNCIDGRAHLPVIQWIKERHDAEYVDMITEPGMDGVIAQSKPAAAAILAKARVSISVNHAAIVFVAGHHDCRGNPVDAPTHKADIAAAVQTLQPELSPTPVIGLWVNDQWQIEPINTKFER